jgi:hypothetical protein
MSTHDTQFPNGRCTDIVGDTLIGYDGVLETRLDYEHARLQITYDPRLLEDAQAQEIAQEAAHRAWARVQHCPLAGTSTCHDCAAHLAEDLTRFFGQPPKVVLQEDGTLVARLRRYVPFTAVAASEITPPPRPAPARHSWSKPTRKTLLTFAMGVVVLLVASAFGAGLTLP